MYRVLAAALLAAFATPAAAQSSWYSGIGFGQSKTSRDLVENRESTVVNATVVGSDFDAEHGAFKVFGGYRISPAFAVEVNYADLGSSTLFTEIVTPETLTGSVLLQRDISGFGIDLLAMAPVGPRFSIFGRVGAVHSRLKADARLSGVIEFTNPPGNTDRRRTVKRDETVLRYGIGADWHLGEHAGLRLEWERWSDVGKAFEIGGSGTTGEADTDFVSIGFVYRY